MNSDYRNAKNIERSKYWTKVNKDLFNLIKEKKIAYLKELQLSLEAKYGSFDIGKSINFLSKNAPIVHLETKKIKIAGSNYKFVYRKKEKNAIIERVLIQKKRILNKFNPITFELGNWADSQFYPRVLKNEGFIVECVRTKKYNLIEIKGDIDIILTPIPLTKSKIFIEVKNRLSVYNLKELYKFFNYLREFNLEIIPVVIARKIFERPKEFLIEYNGVFIEMEKLLVRQKYADISRQYNDLIVNVTRIIPERVIQPDIKAKISKLKTVNKGVNFSQLDYFEDTPENEENIADYYDYDLR